MACSLVSALMNQNSRKSILVVDDDISVTDSVRLLLSDAGYHVQTAHTVARACAIFGAHQFDLVITDHAMPGMTGSQLATIVKETCIGQPVLMLTGFSDPALVRGETPPGVDLLLNKPIPRKALRVAVAQLLR